MFGAIAGATALVAAVPFVVQLSSAESTSSATTQATISQSEAEQAALAAYPGKISESTKNDSHFGGYKVEINGNDGKEYDVIVDATTGKISQNWEDGKGGRHHDEKDEADDNDAEVNDGPDQNDANEVNEKADQPDASEQDGAAQTSSSVTSQAQK